MTPASAAPPPPPRPVAGAEGALAAVLASPDLLGCAVQPVVDLERAVVAGYEVLARPAPRLGVGPAPLFAAAAEDIGSLEALHVLALRTAHPLLADLPPDTFLTVNADARALASPRVLAELLAWGDLGGLVVEVLEERWPDDHGPVLSSLDALRAAGALVALDDVGAAWAGLSRVLEVRPSFVKLDRHLVARLGHDPAVEATVRAVGDMADTLDAWVCLEGVETPDQLAAAARLGVPLAQGYLLGRPAAAWPQPDLAVVRELRSETGSGAGLAGLVRTPGRGDLEVDDRGRPLSVGASLPDGRAWRHPVTALGIRTSPHAALARAMARPPQDRFAPLVVTAADGRALGLVHVDALATAVAASSGRAGTAGRG